MKTNRFNTIITILLFVLLALGSGSTTSHSATNSSNVTKPAKDTDKADKKSELPSISEEIIFEQKDIKITAKEITKDFWGEGLKILIENDSDKDMVVSADSIAVNGYMITDFLYETMTAGTKSNVTIRCLDTDLKNAGISSLGEVAVWFKLSDPDSYSTIYEMREPAIIQTSIYPEMDSSLDIQGTEILNQDGVRLIASYVDENSLWGTSVLIYAENNSGKDIVLTSDNVSINGFMVNSYYYASIKDGYRSFDTMDFLSSDLKENDIDKVESIRLSFNCVNAENIFDSFTTDYVTIEVSE